MTFSEGKPTQYSTSLLRSFQIQLRVIGALLMREILTRYGRHNIGFMWMFVEPMLFTTGVTLLWSFARMHHNSDMPIAAFALTGYSTVLLWRNMPARCIGSVEPNLALTYHRNVKVIDIFASRLLLEAGGTTMSFMILSVFYISIGWVKPPQDLLKVLLGWGMTAWFGMSLALLMGSLSERTEIVEKLWHPTAYLLFPLSGAAFMVDILPPYVQKVVLILPMVHGVELLRDGYFGSVIRTHYNIPYMATVCLLLTSLAFSQERYISKRVTPE